MAVFTVIMISYTAYMCFLCLILCICFYLSCTERHSEAKMQIASKEECAFKKAAWNSSFCKVINKNEENLCVDEFD